MDQLSNQELPPVSMDVSRYHAPSRSWFLWDWHLGIGGLRIRFSTRHRGAFCNYISRGIGPYGWGGWWLVVSVLGNTLELSWNVLPSRQED